MDDFSLTSPVWADVTRVPQDDGPNPAAPISYSKHFQEVMDLFRAVLLLDEHSERTLVLSTAAIECNAANYTAWHFRRKVLASLNADLYDELEFTRQHALESPKNYQIWHHRREIVERLQDSSLELAFVGEALTDDQKNYHAWSYRQWVVKHFSLWDGELAFVDEMLLLDMRNNSAWNHRWFAIHHMHARDVPADIRAREIQVAVSYIRRAPHNESPWNYLRGYLRSSHDIDVAPIHRMAEEIYAEHPTTCIFAANLLVDLHVAASTPDSLDKAKEILHALAATDPIRAPYWTHRLDRLPAVRVDAH
ncbi:hypothetical protein H310_11249 [Aphanomyces invadans]|uniref:Protein farnesyltransferase/geranylgeranyltransferase type-1 subunit alpha n=1 Tax=Aphanomyces invadans TaxID=157072 RepID=A0A024TMJ8_9STRA|nr:hypothetical protein H310_11249 [Aphanomyces invadans]ETV95360.1 hypothetical protein H310_11249 [Aphanomyces invadans]|eukprot:XP_008876061.1 hypothetical protein H310_11249 [Aphanomyces invadans]